MAGSSKGDAQLSWIYEGAKALVNREDYLLGKKLDKNFEMYSDVVTKEDEDNFEKLTSGRSRVTEATTSKISNLEINVVRKEDPLVAIKVKEEKLRQEKLENPLIMMRMQRILREAMEKKARKLRKKEEKMKRKEKKKYRSSRDDRSAHFHKRGERHHHNKKKHGSTSSKERHHQNSDENEDHSKKRKHHNLKRSRKSSTTNHGRHKDCVPQKRSKETTENGSPSSKSEETKATTSEEENHAEKSYRSRQAKLFDSHIPEHLRPRYDGSSESSSESEANKPDDHEENDDSVKLKGYGLCGVKEAMSKSDTRTDYSIQFSSKCLPQKYIKPERRKLTEEEIEARRKEMMENAEWRDAARKKTLKKVIEQEKLEEKDNEGKPVDFIKPMLNSAASTMTVEKRLNSTRNVLQKSYGYMEEKFTKR